MRYLLLITFLTALTAAAPGARTFIAHVPDHDGDGATEKVYAVEWPEPPAPITAERRLTITTGVSGTAAEPYVIDYLNIDLDITETVQTFAVRELTPELVVIYVVYREQPGLSAGWNDVAIMLAARDGRLVPIWSATVANWSGPHGGFDLQIRFDDLDGDGTPEIITRGIGTVDVGVNDEGEKIFENYTIDETVYNYDEAAGVYVLDEERGN